MLLSEHFSTLCRKYSWFAFDPGKPTESEKKSEVGLGRSDVPGKML